MIKIEMGIHEHKRCWFDAFYTYYSTKHFIQGYRWCTIVITINGKNDIFTC